MKVNTVKIKGGADYARVAERMKQFREDNPNGLVETTPTISGTQIMFKARILKDKNNPNSGEATGHSLLDGKGEKVFEKAETVAVGRALAYLGYLASGEIASSEEMEEFLSAKEQQRLQTIEDLKSEVDKINTKDLLREFYKLHRGYGKELDEYITNKSKELT